MGVNLGTIISPLLGLKRLFWGKPPKETTPLKTSSITPDIYPIQIIKNTSAVGALYEQAMEIAQERESRYKDFEDMLLDSLIAGAVQMVTDDACQYSREKNATIWVSSADRFTRTAIEELFDDLNIEDRLFDWAYATVLYGDFFMQVVGRAPDGVVLVQDNWHSADVQRIDVNGMLLGFRTPKIGNYQQSVINDELHDPWDFVHFRIQSAQRRRREVERQRIYPSHRYEANKYRLTTKYGVSMLDPVRRVYKQLTMVEQSLIIARLSRALLKYIYKIQVGNQGTTKDAVELTQEMKHLMTSSTGLKLGEGFEQQYDPLGGAEDIFLPVFGERGDVQVDTLGGDVDIKGIVDVDYLRKKLFGGLAIPPQFLGFSEEGGLGGLGQSSLLRMEIRYARTVKKLQRAIIAAVTRLAQIHLAYRGLNPDPSRFSIEMDIISTAEEEERKNALMSAIDVGGSLTNLIVNDLALLVDRKRLGKAIMTNIVIAGSEFLEIIEDAQEIMPEELMDVQKKGAGGPLRAPGALAAPEAISPEELPPPEGEVTPEEAVPPPLPPESEQKLSVGMLAEAKRDAIASVAGSAKKAADIKAEVPYNGSGKATKSKIREKAYVQIIQEAINREDADRKAVAEREKKLKDAKKTVVTRGKKLIKKIEDQTSG